MAPLVLAHLLCVFFFFCPRFVMPLFPPFYTYTYLTLLRFSPSLAFFRRPYTLSAQPSTFPSGARLFAEFDVGETLARRDLRIGSTIRVCVSSHSMSAGKKAATVLPFLFVLLLGLAYLKISRTRGQAKRSAWSDKLEKRMSTISADWKAITPGGPKEAVR
ncbi:hypothetical protein B0H19DRAFT_74250 [Mycena capillaripes]|nr:hypothetical protein B0H19DRAFT_74250 [Mycena capillaripes]